MDKNWGETSVSLDMQLCVSPFSSVPSQGFRQSGYAKRELDCDINGSSRIVERIYRKPLKLFGSTGGKGKKKRAITRVRKQRRKLKLFQRGPGEIKSQVVSKTIIYQQNFHVQISYVSLLHQNP